MDPTNDMPAAPSPQAAAPPPLPPTYAPPGGYTPATAPRRGGKVVLIVVIAVLLLLCACAGVGVAFLAPVFGKQAAAEKKVEQAIDLMTSSEPVVTEVDAIVQAEVTPELAQRAKAAGARIEPALEDLKEAKGLVEEAKPDLSDDEAKTAAAVLGVVSARVDMLTAGKVLVSANEKAALALGPARQGWDYVLAAEKLVSKADDKYNLHTNTGVAASSILTVQAREKLAIAKKRFQMATAAFPEAGFGAFITYCDRKIAVLVTSKQIDTLWLAGNKTAANRLIDKYNVQEKQVEALYKALPDGPTDVVAAAFDGLTKDATEAYKAAREAATAADTALKAAQGGSSE
ncbi:MAG: hypothetical protein WC971_07580 [Coriobacteriia bacterium]